MTLKIEPRDVWIGAFWDRRADGLHIYVCPLPCIVIHVQAALGGEFSD